jgi:hypothetical protein
VGKASRTKRERREGGGTDVTAHAPKRQLPVFWIVVGAMVVLGIVALVLTRPDAKEQAAKDAAQDAPVYADVTVAGDNLPKYSKDDDPAVGKRLPTITGTSLAGDDMTISAEDGAQVVLVVAHWCPHCQAEVPRIADWEQAGKLPDGVTVRTISTSVDEGRPNFPPAAWLSEVDWPFDTLVDDEAGTAASAMGMDGFPFITFVKADGTVAQRFSGEMDIDDFDAAVRKIAPKDTGATG